MTVDEAFSALQPLLADALVLSADGFVSRLAFAEADRPGNFYLGGSLGLGLPVALGLALAQPGRTVVIVDSGLTVPSSQSKSTMLETDGPPNLIHVIFGGQVLPRGYPRVLEVASGDKLEAAFREALSPGGPTLIVIAVESVQDLARAHTALPNPLALCRRFVLTVVGPPPGHAEHPAFQATQASGDGAPPGPEEQPAPAPAAHQALPAREPAQPIRGSGSPAPSSPGPGTARAAPDAPEPEPSEPQVPGASGGGAAPPQKAVPLGSLTTAPRTSEFWNPVRITFGSGCLNGLPQVLEELGGKRIALVTSADILSSLRLRDRLAALLRGWIVHTYDWVEPNPSPRQMQDAVESCSEFQPEIVVGIGGGSAMDTAKAVAATIPNGRGVLALAQGSRPATVPSIATVLIPTTAGSGSEVTRWATIWDFAGKRRYQLAGDATYARRALLDPDLTLTASASVTAVSGADALAHAMEAYWSRASNPVADALALDGVRRIRRALPAVVAEPDNLIHRAAMLEASLVAGLAVSSTGLGVAHSLSYPLTLQHRVPHGQAVALLLPSLLRFHAELHTQRMSQLADALGSSDADGAAATLEGLLRRSGLKTRLADLGIGTDSVNALSREAALAGVLKSSIRDLNAVTIRQIYDGIC